MRGVVSPIRKQRHGALEGLHNRWTSFSNDAVDNFPAANDT
jgi:hypothetical protein